MGDYKFELENVPNTCKTAKIRLEIGKDGCPLLFVNGHVILKINNNGCVERFADSTTWLNFSTTIQFKIDEAVLAKGV